MAFRLTPKKPIDQMSDDEAEVFARALIAKYDKDIAAADAAAAAARHAAEGRALPKNFERFPARGFEIRAEQKNGKRILKGYAARFSKLSYNLGGFRENLAAGCFSRCLRKNPDILMFRGHDPTAILARCSNRTLVVQEDDQGLKFEAELQDTQVARDVYTDVKAANIRGMSFGMVVHSDHWSEIDDCDPDTDDDCDDEDRGRVPLRTVVDCDLFEISPVSMPAYGDTEVNARALFPQGPPRSMPMELRSLIVRAIELSKEDDEALRLEMRMAAIQTTL
jgi:uncharacterized protein